MPDPTIRLEIEQAVASAWETFSAAHPNLAEQIDQIQVYEQLVETIKDDPRLAAAQAQFARDLDQANLIDSLLDIALPVLALLLVQ